jgi:hypothetical protein
MQGLRKIVVQLLDGRRVGARGGGPGLTQLDPQSALPCGWDHGLGVKEAANA